MTDERRARWIDQLRILVLDFETTGFSPVHDRVIQIGATLLERGEVAWRRSQLVNPGRPGDPKATAIHGITDEMVASAPPFAQAGRLLFEGLDTKGLLIAGHNSAFDYRFMVAEVERHHVSASWLVQPWYCTYALAKLLDGKRSFDKGYKLTDLARKYEIVVEGAAHDAEADTHMTALVLCKLAERLPADPQEVLRMQQAWQSKNR